MEKRIIDNERAIFRIIVGISLFVFVLVIVLNKKILPVPSQVPFFVKYLTALNATLNAICTVLLLFSLYFIKQKKIAIHRRLNITTFILSALFLISYVVYHYFAKETVYPRNNPIRPLYLFILSTHIMLAGLVLPLILLSFYYGLRMEVAAHKKLVRWAYPIWLYVTTTGVVVYLMISPYYPK